MSDAIAFHYYDTFFSPVRPVIRRWPWVTPYKLSAHASPQEYRIGPIDWNQHHRACLVNAV